MLKEMSVFVEPFNDFLNKFDDFLTKQSTWVVFAVKNLVMRNLILDFLRPLKKVLKKGLFTILFFLSPVFLLLMEPSLYVALMISHYVQTGTRVGEDGAGENLGIDTPYKQDFF